ncbi:MAG: thiamine phosphate synthase [Planctomycetes bacterium]|nr:thiamine phosphate synthase [Planctomycetota bacterium]
MNNDSTHHDPPPGVLRIIDAAANRAGEGLRVIEDYLRFVLDDRHLTERCKTLRHDLTAALAPISNSDRNTSREASRDVGAELTTDDEKSRGDVAHVVCASFKRLEQSLRSLEEYTKLFDPAISATLERLRFCTYTLERAVDITRCSIQRLETCRLYVLVDGQDSLEQFEALAQSLIAGGAGAIQLRHKNRGDKHLTDDKLLQRARLLRRMTRDSDTLFFVNDRPDIAVLAGADGVHVGQDELSVKDARTIVGPRPLIGVSTHTIEQARGAVLDGANYIGCGPTFPSRTKQFDDFPGVDFLQQVAAEIRLPAFAIGGISPENLPQVRAAGFNRVAVSAAVTGHDDPGQAARQLLTALA